MSRVSILLVTGCPGKPRSTTVLSVSYWASWECHSLWLYMALCLSSIGASAMAGSCSSVSSGGVAERLCCVCCKSPCMPVTRQDMPKELLAFPALQSAKQDAEQGNAKDFGHIITSCVALKFLSLKDTCKGSCHRPPEFCYRPAL